ncbi:GntR family transcriptional regulator [Sphaerisporangium sp. NPDC051011]|uniref:GntR family transcriptional regulator n=1 Tax=Sphaerisporangium sp. NPDC051011 TaxID=3155792 RepID=UPI0033E2B857
MGRNVDSAEQSKRPAYIRIASDLREQITSGTLMPNDPVPSAAALCQQYDVSMITAKSALNLLRTEGLVYAKAGKGTYVAENRRMTRTAPHRYFEGRERTYVQEAERAGLRPEARHQTTVTPATDTVAQRLEITAGQQVMTTEYRIFAGERPMSKSVSWEPLSITGATIIEHPHQGEHANSGLNARFAAIGWTIEQVEENLIVRPPTPEEAEELAIPEGVHVLEVHQTVRATQEGTDNLVPVEAAVIVFPTDRYQFTYLMDRPR